MPPDSTFEAYSLVAAKKENEEILFELDIFKTIALLALSNIMMIRMSCIDFPHRNQILKTFLDMVKNDGKWMFVRGLPALLMCEICYGSGIMLAQRYK